ncbi:MAG: HAD hydrolase-like protein [Oscillospiraceae bacterium]|jgi:phosphoglycolate phosphatase|nr:HAD hydrolase-like protein [Oscillospiraceae bacterium]
MGARFDAVLLDFDGTFADTSEGVLASANTALEELGYPTMGLPEFRKFLGPPLEESFHRFLGMDRDTARRAIDIYRREYRAGNCLRLRIYDGLPALLLRLRTEGFQLGIASAKPTVFLERILAGLGMRDLFAAVSGVALDRLDTGKADLIAAAARDCGTALPQTLMVGDRRFDMEGAKAAGAPCAGALFGFGSREELLAAGADYLIEDIAALERVIFGCARS